MGRNELNADVLTHASVGDVTSVIKLTRCVRLYVCMSVCIYVNMYVYMCVHIHANTDTHMKKRLYVAVQHDQLTVYFICMKAQKGNLVYCREIQR